MTREQLFFIRTLSDHLNGRSTYAEHDLDWYIIHNYAQKHQVSGIIYSQAKHFMPSEILADFRQEAIATYFYYENRKEDYHVIKKALSGANIPFFAIKGIEIADLYPEPSLRAMGDIDLVVHSDDRGTCHMILLKEGFNCKSKQEDREWQYYRNNLETELHDRLVYRESINEKGHMPYFNNCWKYVTDGKLEWNFHLLFLIFHLRKHLMNAGAGFRQFMDLAVALRKTETNWKWIEKQLKTTGLYDFARKCYGFIFRWFGIPSPIMDQIEDEFFDEATQKVFVDGVFGFDNDENLDCQVINEIRRNRCMSLGMIKVAIRYVFLPLKEMKSIKKYEYLNNAPVLLPAAWIHRIITSAGKTKKKSALTNLRKSFVSKEKIEKRKNLMSKWGV